MDSSKNEKKKREKARAAKTFKTIVNKIKIKYGHTTNKQLVQH